MYVYAYIYIYMSTLKNIVLIYILYITKIIHKYILVRIYS